MNRDRLQHLNKLTTLLATALILNFGGFIYLGNKIEGLPDKWTVDTPPDLNMGMTRKMGERDPYQVHGYAVMMHQLLNSWYELDDKFDISRHRGDEEKIGEQQPLSLLSDYRCLITPEFKDELEVRRRNMLNAGQYFGQERVVNLIPGKGFSDVGVYELGNSWVVDLPMRQTEYWKGKELYSRDISVKYRVVGGESRAVNCGGLYWNFQLAGYYEEPKEINLGGAGNE
ncbi:TIGR03746 family integrating conjugative element protein [Vibrio tubiashii]|uniref:DUF2895 family protein n=1 Tax=Vibrio tubiashii TaxID=29498 RepID=UPI001EFE2E9E|nr:DUF2895 family protein [Vibrio tubiashii]MCG9576706.1 TIGR03746 family integrating conjugative element protein [Vibrio tubiashii]